MAKKYQKLSAIYYLWILIFIIAPILLLIYQSFFDIYGNFTLNNYISYFSNKNYMIMTFNSLLTAFLITAFTLLWAYPFSYFLSKAKHKDILVASYVELPFMIIPIFRAIDSIPNEYIIASEDLGANKFQTLRKIILPLSMDGVMAASQAVFIPSLSLFLITRIIGGNKIITLGTAVEEHYLVTQNWGMGSTIGLVLIFMMFAVISILNKKAVKDGK